MSLESYPVRDTRNKFTTSRKVSILHCLFKIRAKRYGTKDVSVTSCQSCHTQETRRLAVLASITSHARAKQNIASVRL